MERDDLTTQVFCSRPLNHLARSSPIAGRALHSRLRALVRHYGKYYPAPPASRSPAPPNRTPVTPVPLGVLTDRIVERVLTEACFAAPEVAAAPSSDAAVDSSDMLEPLPEIDDAELMQTLHDRYAGAAGPTKDWTLTIPSARGVGPCSYLVVPGWVRARAADILFGDGPAEDESVTEQVISTLLKVRQAGGSMGTDTNNHLAACRLASRARVIHRRQRWHRLTPWRYPTPPRRHSPAYQPGTCTIRSRYLCDYCGMAVACE